MLEAILSAIGMLLGVKDSMSSKSEAERQHISCYIIEVSGCLQGIATSAKEKDRAKVKFFCGQLDFFIDHVPSSIREHIGANALGQYKQKLRMAKQLPLSLFFGADLMQDRAIDLLMSMAGELSAMAHTLKQSALH